MIARYLHRKHGLSQCQTRGWHIADLDGHHRHVPWPAPDPGPQATSSTSSPSSLGCTNRVRWRRRARPMPCSPPQICCRSRRQIPSKLSYYGPFTLPGPQWRSGESGALRSFAHGLATSATPQPPCPAHTFRRPRGPGRAAHGSRSFHALVDPQRQRRRRQPAWPWRSVHRSPIIFQMVCGSSDLHR